jgi:hypothetical protein
LVLRPSPIDCEEARTEKTLTFLSYFTQTQTWDGTQWQITSTSFALAHTDNGDNIDFTIGPGGLTISASATAVLNVCMRAFPDCALVGSVELEGSWEATGSPVRSPGYHIRIWTGSGYKIDFRSGTTVARDASATFTIDGQTPAGTMTLAQVEKVQGVEVNLCRP